MPAARTPRFASLRRWLASQRLQVGSRKLHFTTIAGRAGLRFALALPDFDFVPDFLASELNVTLGGCQAGTHCSGGFCVSPGAT